MAIASQVNKSAPNVWLTIEIAEIFVSFRSVNIWLKHELLLVLPYCFFYTLLVTQYWPMTRLNFCQIFLWPGYVPGTKFILDGKYS
jgi:hypothetical protein